MHCPPAPYIRRRTTRNRRSKSLRSIACPRYRSVLDINRYRKAAASQRIIQLHSDRGPAHRVHGRAYATCLKTCGSPVAQGAERPSPSLAGLWRKAKPWGLLEKIGVEMIRQCSKTRRSRSVLKCRRYTRCREPRADAIPWQKRLPQRSECAGTGRRV